MNTSEGTRRQRGLPSEHGIGSAKNGGRVLVQDTPERSRSYGEIPIASEDEDTTDAHGTQSMKERTAGQTARAESAISSTLPSSSPIRFPSTDIPGDDSDDEYRLHTPRPDVDQNPLRTPRLDDNDTKGVEEGELLDDRTPPSNQQQTAGQRTRSSGRGYEGHPGEPRTPPFPLPATSQRKRHWAGSPGSEEQGRTASRPRWGERTPERSPERLPPIAELLANPWGGPGIFDDANSQRPLASSTPRSFPQGYLRDDHERYEADSQANVSGQAPTSFARANTTAGSHRAARVLGHGRGFDRAPMTASWVAQGEDDQMRVDEDDADESALLRTPPGSNSRVRRDARNNLRDVLADPPSQASFGGRPGGDAVWRGGYAPRHWDQSARGRDGRGRVPAVEDLDTYSNRSNADATFFPLPHTRAWQHQQEYGRGQTRPTRNGEVSGVPNNMRTVRDGPVGGRGDLDAGRDPTSAPSQTASQSRARATANAFEYGQREAGFEADWHGDAHDGEHAHDAEDWRDYEILPTAVAQAPRDEGAPSLAENPRDGQWIVHFDDPERLVSGQSAGWQQKMWHDPSAVIFTAYNYRYTPHGVVNRHVEGAVAAITTYVTGETQFHIVPPHPDPTRKLSVRELPFTWGIRGLTQEGAARMKSVRVASSLGVSIITYPKRLGNPRWVCSLVGFLRPDAEVIKAAVMEVLQEPEMLTWIERMAKDSRSLRSIPSDERAEYILSTLDVKIADLEKGDFMANVYMEPPTDDMAEFRTWSSYMRRREYNNFLNGTGVARAIYYCGGCRGVDHDTMRCPFPEMEGWQGTRQGAQSHTADILDTKDTMRSARGGAPRGRGASGSWTRGGRDWDASENQHGRDGRESAGRGSGWRTRTPAGRSPWAGGHQQQNQRRRYPTQQRFDETRGGWRE